MTDSMRTVVFLHGLARTRRSLSYLRTAVEDAGYNTWARSYPSRKLPIRDLADRMSRQILEETAGRELWAVTHSLGGILVRHMAEHIPWKGLVMLAPPNQGSRVAALMHERSLYRGFFGPAGRELANPANWPEPPSPFGVIAGTRKLSLKNPTSWMTKVLKMFPPEAPHDGTLAVDETMHPAMADFTTVDATHTSIMNHPDAKRLVLLFLETGSFQEVAAENAT